MGRKKRQLSLPHVPESKERAKGNPIVAFRVDRKLLRSFVKRHGGMPEAQRALRAYMQRSSGGVS